MMVTNDSVNYLSNVSLAITSYSADPNNIIIYGISNGAFMAHRWHVIMKSYKGCT